MNRRKRMLASLALMLINKSDARIRFLKKHHLYGSIGENVFIQKRKLPLHSNLIHIHNNVKIASNVGFVTHDIIHKMLNDMTGEGQFVERVGCIEIMDNVFIGSGTRILYGTRIGRNVIIGSDSFVNRDVPDNSVYAGVPARFICTFDSYVEKARAYSQHMNEAYGVKKLVGMPDELAVKLYEEFLLERKGHA